MPRRYEEKLDHLPKIHDIRKDPKYKRNQDLDIYIDDDEPEVEEAWEQNLHELPSFKGRDV